MAIIFTAEYEPLWWDKSSLVPRLRGTRLGEKLPVHIKEDDTNKGSCSLKLWHCCWPCMYRGKQDSVTGTCSLASSIDKWLMLATLMLATCSCTGISLVCVPELDYKLTFRIY